MTPPGHVPLTHALVLRPEPGNAATCTRLRDLGVRAIGVPLFEVRAIPWEPPPDDRYDALLLTSANAARHAGAALDLLRSLPVVAVGKATAAAARAAGLHVAVTGTGDAPAALALAPYTRVLHLAGRHRRDLPNVAAVTVYESVERTPELAQLDTGRGAIALLHSPRAATGFAALLPRDARAATAVAALSTAVADAAGEGWRCVAASDTPDDAALVALAATMIDRSAKRADKPVP